jgi:predicted hotdog family 3-hydroxylacyl-ACP dehydratase
MLEHDEICKLIPHDGKMCLLDKVKNWNKKSITCTTSTHRNKSNPLRSNEGLPMLSLLEYGAQAMAVHGCLLAEMDGFIMKEGYLASLRDINFADGLLSEVEDELVINMEHIYAESGNMIYTMSISANNIILASGRISVAAKFITRK